ncbi:hypothetical protein [Nitrospira sp. BLG_1]|uniref:hypothetical protein n=1 Tax=Nitrospira sp. BLG_1 TaxID=3395883 RepID=UPI0039BCEF23
MSMYGEEEIINFAKGMAQRTGVDIRVRKGKPKTDGKTVWLDCEPCKNETEYLIRTGDADHEIAHAWFESWQHLGDKPKTMAALLGDIQMDWLMHECMNVVVDVHDESRMEKLIPGTQAALRTGNLYAGAMVYEKLTEAYRNGTPAPLGWRDLLMTGLANARLGNTSSLKTGKTWLSGFDRRQLQYIKQSQYYDGIPQTVVDKVIAILKSCSEKGAKNVARRASDWKRICDQAEELFKTIRPFVDQADKLPEQPSNAGAKGSGDGGGAEGEAKSSGNKDQQNNDPGKRVRQKSENAAKGNNVNKDPYDPSTCAGGGVSSPMQPQSQNKYRPKNGFYNQCLNEMSKTVEVLMETSEAMRLVHYRDSGQTLGKKWVRLFTDQRVFVTKDRADGHELSMALLLDCSGSMSHILGDCSAACAAIGMAAKGFGAEVRSWVFGDYCKEVPIESLRDGVPGQGGTAGSGALKDANRWLDGQASGRKLVVIITDGSWSDSTEARGLVVNGARNGIEYSMIGLGGVSTHNWPTGIQSVSIKADAKELSRGLLSVVGSGIK